ncbi:hypothetical protein ASPSYDRAFT_38888 [Aspergillus sydowii CBS 593.65]|uniref:RelA/SpoT domain-containing protein n=1 Tax=Aspergillus sydowii CBS 593.65 TaxID=1036612 RepID=A0A1L9TXM9_9EURO|nr:uncharacterized protein ASPSYDRAFT_38888 [Aspergillus sydowii CBS 593.65]OJJ64204.1 hypothetical protein ASPSYDRAFT_38888 [Aspergillus sydowii CBS 593.65]
MDRDSNALWWAGTVVPYASKRSAEMVADRLRLELRQAGIIHDIKSNAIEKAKLAAELKAREFARGRPYTQREEIEADVIDLANVWVYVYLPQDKDKVRNIVTEAFNIRGDIGEKLEDPDLCTEYYWVSLEGEQEEDQEPPTRLVEIQVVTDKGDRQFQASHEVAAFLHKLAKIKGRRETDCGDARLLWEVLQILGSNRHRDLRNLMLGLDMSNALASDFSRKADAFAPLKLSLATYVTDSITRLQYGRDKMLEIAHVEGGDHESNRERYRMRVLRDTFIWLADLYPWGDGTGSMLFHDLDISMANLQRKRVRWLDSLEAKSFYEGEQQLLPHEEGKNIAKLWAMFVRHTQLPAQYSFNLARLDVKGPTPPNWAYFHRAITGLVYDQPKDEQG